MPELTEEQRKELEEKIKSMSPDELQEFQKQQCIFCQIISGKILSKKVYEDELLQGILDINPAAKGHILLLPKEHYTIMPHVPDEIIAHLFLVSKYLSQAVLKVLKVTGTNLFIANGQAAGQRSQHFMLHIIPRKENDHVLDLQEKIISSDLQEKVRTTVETRLNQVLGIKKEEKKVPSQKEKIVPEEIAAAEARKKPSNAVKSKFRRSKNLEKPSSSPKNYEEMVNLDDIASLFK